MELGKSILALLWLMVTCAGPSGGIGDGVGVGVGVGGSVGVGRGVGEADLDGVEVGIAVGVGTAVGVGVREGLGELVAEGVDSKGLKAVLVGTIVGANGDVCGLEVPPQENISVEASAAIARRGLRSRLCKTICYREIETSFRI